MATTVVRDVGGDLDGVIVLPFPWQTARYSEKLVGSAVIMSVIVYGNCGY